MPDIYDLHKRAFPNVAAYVILHGSEKVATIAFKYPRDGAGRLYAYVHWLGVEMVRGFAGGYGYDKHSAACANAVSRGKIAQNVKAYAERVGAHYATGRPWFEQVQAFETALRKDDGQYWNRNLELAGFTVLQAI